MSFVVRARSREVALQGPQGRVLQKVLQPGRQRGDPAVQHGDLRAEVQVGGGIQAYHAQAHERRHLQLPTAAALLARSRAIQLTLPDRDLR